MALFKFNLNKIATLRAALKKAKEEAEYYKAANAKLIKENYDLRVELKKQNNLKVIKYKTETCDCGSMLIPASINSVKCISCGTVFYYNYELENKTVAALNTCQERCNGKHTVACKMCDVLNKG